METSDHSYNLNDAEEDLAGSSSEEIVIAPGKFDIPAESAASDEDRGHEDTAANICMRSTIVKDICPFVCGVCSEKFDKVDLFYAHLKTHGNLIGDQFEQMKPTKNKSENEEVQKNLDDADNFFKCGICWKKFPSMSLLHEHMLKVEHILNYSYSNADHTAKPDSRIVESQSDSDLDTDDFQATNKTSSVTFNLGKEKTAACNVSSTGTQTRLKQKITGYEDGERKQNKLTKNRPGTKRKVEETESPMKRVKKSSDDMKSSSACVILEAPVIQTYKSRGNLSPSTRSSRRTASKRVDYKALAGLGSPKYEAENGVNTDTTESHVEIVKETSLGSENENGEEQNESPLTKDVEMNLKTCSSESEKQMSDDKGENDNNKVHFVKVVSKKRMKSYTIQNDLNKKENIRNTTDMNKLEVNEKNTYIRTKKETDTKGKNSDKLEEPSVKADGTLIDTEDQDSESIKIEVNLDSDLNASDYDSDDDFREEESYDETYNDDDQADPDFKPEIKNEENDEDGLIVSLNDTHDPEVYLKKFNVRKRRIFKNRDGQPLKNCLYPCAVCGRYYIWKALRKHMYAHVTTREVECKECGKKYKSTRHLKDHFRSVHAMKKYACPKCSSILKGNQSFEKHVMTHILKKEITEALDEVEKVEVTEEEYEIWRAEHADKMASKCPQRKKPKQKSTGNRDRLIVDGLDLDTLKEGPLHGEHVVLESRIVGTSKNLDCKVCKKHFITHESLITHMLEHKDEEHFSCKICRGFFQTPEHLQNHMVSVHGDRELECDICGEHLRSSYALWSHKGKHLMKKDPYYSEETVQKLQAEIAERGRKTETVQKKETVQCQVCGLHVLTVRYKRHMEVHTTTKDWECDICHHFYKTRRYLIDHRKKTHFATLIACDICGQKFKSNTYLEIHKQTHGPKDKKCPHCDKGFTTMMYLKTHMLTHEDKKRFRCEKCMAAFSHKQRLTIHMMEVHGDGASRPCKYCGDLFSSRQKARKHERIAHEGFILPNKIKKNYRDFEADSESLENKIVRLLPSTTGSGFTMVTPGVVKVPKNKNENITSNAAEPAGGDGNFIKLENGDEYEVMIEKDGSQSLEFVELTEEEQNVIIQEADGVISQSTPLVNDQGNNVEQILEIPESAEQCQILLYPDGTFKLLNVVDNTNSV